MENALNNSTVKVLLADDHTMFRQGIAEMLATDEGLKVVGEARDGAEAVELARQTCPHVVLLDIEMPVMGAREAMAGLLELSPAPRVVIVTMFDNPRLVQEFLEGGASGYLAKSASLKELISAVYAAAESPDGAPASTIPRPEPHNRNDGAGSARISGRELDVLLLAARGMSNSQIAATLHIAEATVKRHLANIYTKLEVGSRTEAANKALRAGWISSQDLLQKNIMYPNAAPAAE